MLRVFGVVLLFSSPLVSSFTLWRVEQQRCDSRKTSSSLIRSAIVVAVDEVGIYADVREPERGDLRDRVYARVIKEYPPPEC